MARATTKSLRITRQSKGNTEFPRKQFQKVATSWLTGSHVRGNASGSKLRQEHAISAGPGKKTPRKVLQSLQTVFRRQASVR